MSPVVLLLGIGLVLFVFQVVFFIMCVRWLAASKRKREREFALLDAERHELKTMQARLVDEMRNEEKECHHILKQLKAVGAEAQSEWDQTLKKISLTLPEIEKTVQKMIEERLSLITKQKLAMEKVCQESQGMMNHLNEMLDRAQKMIRIFDHKVPTEEILKEIQSDKYERAKNLLSEGHNASAVAKKLGLSLSEISVISSQI